MFVNHLKRALGRFLPRRPAPILVPCPPTLRQVCAVSGVDLDAWVEGARREPRLYVHLADRDLERLHAQFPGVVERTVRAADDVLAHRFDLLGSGSYVPVDPDRPEKDGYRPIDWYLDPVRGSRFRQMVPYKEWDLFSMRPENADIKLPWELGRCQHWVPLGQAWQLTGDERYAREISRQLQDFLEVNPVGMGVNWTCTMDVAIRAANWAIALEMIRNADFLGAEFWAGAYEALYDHGYFIANNLENHYEVTSNHFLSNVVGLFFVSAVFRDMATGCNWDTFCRQALEVEIAVQVLPDGADYESSVPYHRLVTELFMAASRLADHHGAPLSKGYRDTLSKMLVFMEGVLRPDGRMPQFGDADDGRFHIFTDFSDWDPQDPRHLFAPAAAMFTNPEWSSLGGVDGAWEAAWWGFALSPVEAMPPPSRFRLYEDAGIAVMREHGHYLAVTNGIVGTKGFGNHKHNDQLSFEYHHAGQPLIVDPGSYVYTPDFDARNRFRSTAYHNTLQVDSEEQNELKPEWLFRMFETARAEHMEFKVLAEFGAYRGRHVGYTRFSQGVTHERLVALSRDSGALWLRDVLIGQGRHRLHWHFHLAPDVRAETGTDGTFIHSAGGRYQLVHESRMKVVINDAGYSPSYGRQLPCQALDISVTADLKGSLSFEFEVRPAETVESGSFAMQVRDVYPGGVA